MDWRLLLDVAKGSEKSLEELRSELRRRGLDKGPLKALFPIDKPYVGLIVHYYSYSTYAYGGAYRWGGPFPAIVTEVHNEGEVQLLPFRHGGTLNHLVVGFEEDLEKALEPTSPDAFPKVFRFWVFAS